VTSFEEVHREHAAGRASTEGGVHYSMVKEEDVTRFNWQGERRDVL
jgi:hypothetical protein